MLKTVKLQTHAFHYEGAHQSGAGREGATLRFDIILEPLTKPSSPGGAVIERPDGLEWVATVDIHNGPEDRPTPQGSSDCRAQAFGRNPIETLDKLADNLRRVADALDQSLGEGILVPIKLHRRKASSKPGSESLDAVLASSGDPASGDS